MRHPYFSWDPIDGQFQEHPTEAEARAEAESALNYCRDDSGDSGWPEETEAICWGRITETVEEIERREVDRGEDSPDPQGFDYIANFKLCPVSPAPAPAALEAAKAALERLCDAWDSADDCPDHETNCCEDWCGRCKDGVIWRQCMAESVTGARAALALLGAGGGEETDGR